jgi:hypothetical protein
MPSQSELIIIITSILACVVIFLTARSLHHGDVETVILTDGTKVKRNRCQCGNLKNVHWRVCWECEHYDRCRCGKLKSKGNELCGDCTHYLQLEIDRIEKGPRHPGAPEASDLRPHWQKPKRTGNLY